MLVVLEGIVMCFVLLIVCVVGIANGPVGLVTFYEPEVQQRVIEYIRTRPFGDSDRIALTCHKDNHVALRLYERKGFRATGAEYDDEVELAI